MQVCAHWSVSVTSALPNSRCRNINRCRYTLINLNENKTIDDRRCLKCLLELTMDENTLAEIACVLCQPVDRIRSTGAPPNIIPVDYLPVAVRVYNN